MIERQKTQETVPAYRIDTTTDGFKFELLLDMFESYMHEIKRASEFLRMWDDVIIKDTKAFYTKKKLKGFKERFKYSMASENDEDTMNAFLIRSIKEFNVEGPIRMALIGNIVSDKMKTSVLDNILEKTPAFPEEKADSIVYLYNMFSQFDDNCDLFKVYIETLKALINKIEKAQNLFVDRIYVTTKEKQAYELSVRIEEYKLRDELFPAHCGFHHYVT